MKLYKSLYDKLGSQMPRARVVRNQSQKALSCLKEVGLYKERGGGWKREGKGR